MEQEEEEEEEEDSSLNDVTSSTLDDDISQQWKVKVNYSLVRQEPLLKIVTIEDQPTRDFYRNNSASVAKKKPILKKEPSSRLDFHRLSSLSPPSPPLNIFNPSSSPSPEPTTFPRPRRSRLEIYIKPYRGEPNRPPSAERRRRTSPSPVKKSRVSWSPVRESIPPVGESSLEAMSSHAETMEHYERLLERMRRTDEELLSLSQRLKKKREETVTVKTTTRNELIVPVKRETFSPALLQMCLILLVLCNLLVAYFFNDLNIWWSEHLHSSS